MTFSARLALAAVLAAVPLGLASCTGTDRTQTMAAPAR